MSGPTLRQLWRDGIRDSTDPLIGDPITVAVAMALDRQMDAEGRTHTGQKKLARYAKVRTTETVVDRIARLEAAGWLEVRRPERSGQRTYYQAVIPGADRPTASDASPSPDRPTASDGSSEADRPTPPKQTVRRHRPDRPTPSDRPRGPRTTPRGEGGAANVGGPGSSPAAPGRAPGEEDSSTESPLCRFAARITARVLDAGEITAVYGELAGEVGQGQIVAWLDNADRWEADPDHEPVLRRYPRQLADAIRAWVELYPAPPAAANDEDQDVDDGPVRCGSPTYFGRPCQVLVWDPPCPVHRRAEQEDGDAAS